MSPDASSPSGRRPGMVAAALAAAAPPIAVLTTAAELAVPPWNEMPKPLAVWLLLAFVAACGAGASVLLWRGLWRGAFSPLPILGLAAAPWVAGLGLAAIERRAMTAWLAGSHVTMADLLAATPSTRIVALLATWALAGSVGFALAVAAVAGRSGPPRARDILVAAASPIPLIVLVMWRAASGELAPLWMVGGLLALALWTVPIVGLAGASPPSGGVPAPADRWRAAVGLAAALAFCAAASLYGTVTQVEASRVFAAAPDPDPALLTMVREDLSAASRFRWIGLALALLPAAVLALRGPAWRRPAAAGMGAVAILVAVIFLDGGASSVTTPMGDLADVLDSRAVDLESSAAADPASTTSPEGPPQVSIEMPGATDGTVEGVIGGVDGGIPGGVVGGVPEGIDAPPPAATGKLVEAVALSRPAPEFPAGALAAGERRTVVVEVEIGADGGVTGARTITPAATPLANAALAAARKTRFRPALRDGAPVPSTQLITYQFVNE